MKWTTTILGVALTAQLAAAAAPPDASAIMSQVLEADPWGLGGAVISAHATLADKRSTTSELAFTAKSKRYDPPLSKSLVRFSAPPDLAGASFLQVQKREGDDDRYLFLPELKRSRRIAGNLRANSFMGTDFSFADLDRRDVRDGTPTIVGEESIGKFPCYVVDVVPKRDASPYSHETLWIRKDIFLTLRTKMFDKAGVLCKTLDALEVRRVGGHWFISKSRMHDVQHEHTTELVLDVIEPKSDLDDDEFTLRALEKAAL